MMLNRDNYEMYFLLYIDNELDAAQREQVESFIQQHPDLAIELADLQNTLLTEAEETIVPFPDKAMLYRQADKETELLSYIDDELNTAEKEALEKEIQLSPALQHQLQQLQQAVLPQENIVFEHKESLYRYQSSRVIPMPAFIRRSLTAAAVLAAVAVTGWWLFNNGSTDVTQPGQASNQPAGSNPPKVATPKAGSNAIPADSSSLAMIAPAQGTTASGRKDQEQTSITQSTAPVIANVTRPETTPARQHPGTSAPATAALIAGTRSDRNDAKTIRAAIVKSTTGNTDNVASRPSRVNTPVNLKPGQEASLITTPAPTDEQSFIAANTITARSTPSRPGIAANIPEASDNTEPSEQQAMATLAAMPHKTTAAGVTAKPAVYKELEVMEGNESLYIGNLELNKNKLAGIFKRAGRLFGKQSR